MWRIVLLVGALFSGAAHAAACCMSASVLGNGRLGAWEDGATGLTTSWSHGAGRFDSAGRHRAQSVGLLEDELRVEAWGIVRLAERWQLSARVPWVTGMRASTDGTSSIGTGLGDVSAMVRWEPVTLGEFDSVPGLAVLAQVIAPTGRRPEQATDPLGASSTGRGAFAASLGLVAEVVEQPWFARFDVAGVYTASFRRADTQQLQRFGPGVQVGLSGGRELFSEMLVVALSLRLEHELPLRLEGRTVADSESTGLTAAISSSFRLTARWLVTAAVSSDALGRLGVAQNRADLMALNLGVRHGFF